MGLVLEENKTVGGVIATFKLEEYLRTWGDISYGDIAVDGLVDFLGSLPTDGEFTIGGEYSETYEGFYTDDDALEMLNCGLEQTTQSGGDQKDKELTLEFSITYNGSSNHQMILDLLKSYKLEEYFTFDIKQKTIPKAKRLKDDTNNGIKEVRDENDNLIMTYTLMNGKVHGELVAYHENGQVYTRIDLLNNKFCGPTYTEYYDNGQVAQIIYYPKGRKKYHSDDMIRYWNGELNKQWDEKDGFRGYVRLKDIRFDIDRYDMWYINNTPSAHHWVTKSYRSEHNIKIKLFYPNGKLRLTLEGGVYTEYFEDGNIKSTNLKGQNFIKNDKGELAFRRVLVDGKVDGKYIYDTYDGAFNMEVINGKLVGEGEFRRNTFKGGNKYPFTYFSENRYDNILIDINEETDVVLLKVYDNSISFKPNSHFIEVITDLHDLLVGLPSEKVLEGFFNEPFNYLQHDKEHSFEELAKEKYSAGEVTNYEVKETLDIGLDWASKDTPSYEITWTINGDEKVGKYSEGNGGGLYCEKNTETGEQTQYLPNGEKFFEMKKNNDGSCSIWYKEYKPELRLGHDQGHDTIRKLVNNN